MEKIKLVDRAFARIERHWRLAALIGVMLLVGLWFGQRAIKPLIEPHKSFFEFLALVFGPPVTAIGFYLGYRSKRDMVDTHKRSTDASNASQARLVEMAGASEANLLQLAQELSSKTRAATELDLSLRRTAAELAASKSEIEQRTRDLTIERSRVERLDSNLRRVTDGGHDLWKAAPPRPFPHYYEWLRAPKGAKIITVGNLKGGVGKTTLAANLAAYISQTREKPVLLIDLDYQGSLSNMLMFAAGYEEVPSNVDALFLKEANLETLASATIHLHRKMAQAWLVPASYSLGSTEGRLLLEWLMSPDGGTDARYRLAELLLNPSIRQRYEAIILDMPPRLTLGAVNALVASHYLLVPSMLDSLSAEAVRQFLATARAIANDMSLDLDLLGIVGSMSRRNALSEREKLAWERIGEGSQMIWNHREYRFPRTIPLKADIAAAAGEDVAYLANASNAEIFKALGDQIWERLFPADNASATELSPQVEE